MICFSWVSRIHEIVVINSGVEMEMWRYTHDVTRDLHFPKNVSENLRDKEFLYPFLPALSEKVGWFDDHRKHILGQEVMWTKCWS